MSHTVKIEVELTDINALKTTCNRLNLKFEENSIANLYADQQRGFVIHLPNWRYPIIVNNGNVFYDNYNGQWGDIAELNKLKMYYGVEKVKALARAKGYAYRELTINNKPQIRITVGV